MINCNCDHPKISWVRPVKDLSTGKLYRGRVAEELYEHSQVNEDGIRFTKEGFRCIRGIRCDPICQECDGLISLDQVRVLAAAAGDTISFGYTECNESPLGECWSGRCSRCGAWYVTHRVNLCEQCGELVPAKENRDQLLTRRKNS